jgi:hypothetical protein
MNLTPFNYLSFSKALKFKGVSIIRILAFASLTRCGMNIKEGAE